MTEIELSLVPLLRYDARTPTIHARLAEGSLRAAAAAPEELRGTLAWFDVAAGIGFGLVALGALAFLGELFLVFTSAHRADYVVAPVTAAPPPTPATQSDTATATGS